MLWLTSQKLDQLLYDDRIRYSLILCRETCFTRSYLISALIISSMADISIISTIAIAA